MKKEQRIKKVTKKYLDLREHALKYSNEDMNLELNSNEQVYLAVFDIPIESVLVGFHTQTLVLIFGLNTQIYHGSGEIIVGLEKDSNVMKAMQSLFISSSQVLKVMQLTSDTTYFESDKIRAYLKTKKGVFFKELNLDNREDRFLNMLLENIMIEIAKAFKKSE